MAQWYYNQQDREIVFLIKTMKHGYLEDTVKKGKFCFNIPAVFNCGEGLASAQQDKWDSHLSFDASHLYIAPIVEENETGIKYGKAQLLAEKARIHQISTKSKYTPLCSFRKVEPSDLIEKYDAFFFRLGDVVDRLKAEFQHDSFILIAQPHLFLKRLFKKYPGFARSIHYGDIDAVFDDFLENSGFSQAEMFQKDKSYEWQKEFRVILQPTREAEKVFAEIGSIEDFTISGNIEELRNGFVFCKNENHLRTINDLIARDGLTLKDIFYQA